MANTSANSRRSSRVGEFMDRARKEATLPRMVAAGTVAAGAAAYALLRDPARRERLKKSARDYVERGSAWWNDGRGSQKTPSASHIPVA